NRYRQTDLYIAKVNELPTKPYQCSAHYANSHTTFYDEYSYESALDKDAMYLLNEGSLEHAYSHFGAHFSEQQNRTPS
ncbi:hypothetical protein V6248_19795, partial [Pseudoalteromonas agarivorans]|uniref:hypothetical protein n=1 Tax=Pseudoalteromonas agarivorans TaxID=176102 RepID=UPI00311E889A